MFILDCTELDQMCYNWKPILIVFKYLIYILQWTVPLILLVLGSIDMFKAMTRADKEEAVTDARKSLIKRIIYGLVIFLVPFVVRLILNLVEDNTVNDGDYVGATSWISCWNNVMDKDYSDCDDIYQKKNQDSIVDDEDNDDGSNENKNSTTNNCSNYVCPKNAKFLSSAKSFAAVYYKNDCYCKASIPDSSNYESSETCSDIIIKSSEESNRFYSYKFSQSDINSGTVNCYFQLVTTESNSETNNSDNNKANNKSCKECSNGAKFDEQKKLCINDKVSKPTDLLPENNNCKYACGNKAIEANEYSKDGYDMCQCIYEPTCD